MAEDTPTEVPAEAVQEQSIPYDRFAKKIAEVKALEIQLAEASQSIDTAKAWEMKHTELANEQKTERAAWDKKSALYEAGISDKDVADLAMWRFEKSGSDNFREWLTEGAKEDSILRGILNKPPAEAAAVAADTPKPVAQPNPNSGTRSNPPPRGEFSPESVQGMSVAELKANYGKIASAWGYTPHTLD